MRSSTKEARGHHLEDRRLPYFARPQKGEALLSWAWRLAEKFEWNLETLARAGWDFKDPIRPDWWLRPNEALLLRLLACTGVEPRHLRAMTFLDWSAPPWHEKDDARLGGWLPGKEAAEDRSPRIAVCTECLHDDETPFLRQTWLIPWVAACEKHGSVLMTRCPSCRWSLRMPIAKSKTMFIANLCNRCRFDLRGTTLNPPAPEGIRQFQEVLLHGLKTESVRLPGMPAISWPEFITVARRLRSSLSAERLAAEMLALVCAVSQDERFFCKTGSGTLRDRLGGVMLLAWLFDDWPNNLAALETDPPTPMRESSGLGTGPVIRGRIPAN